MGLLDSVMGSVGGALAGQLNQGLAQALGQGGTAQVIEGLVRALGNGGLASLVQQLQKGGLAEAAASWVSTGQNLPVSADQLQQALGPDLMGQLAGSVGLNAGQAAGPLAQYLPMVVDALTPKGQMPQGNADLSALLPQVLGQLMKG